MNKTVEAKLNLCFNKYMKNYLIAIISVIVLLALAGLLYFSYVTGIFSFLNKQQENLSGVILFYGEGCSHCVNVDKFIFENKIEDKLIFSRLEVFKNTNNSKILVQKANTCGLPTDKIGVPFLWDGSKCVVGDVDIIKFFQEKINAK